MLVLKSEAIGVDFIIDKMQKVLHSKLNTFFTDWNSYHRSYKNPKNVDGRNVIIPEVYTEAGEYKECYFDDIVAMSSFFIVSDSRVVSNSGLYLCDISIIFQTKLNEVFPDILHRADEELIIKITDAINKTIFRKYLNAIKTGINEVYSEFDKTQIKYDDMSYYHVCRFDFKDVSYSPNEKCCNNC